MVGPRQVSLGLEYSVVGHASWGCSATRRTGLALVRHTASSQLRDWGDRPRPIALEQQQGSIHAKLEVFLATAHQA